eukprot:14810089-Alexandrium_andersonii.AAC.1
MHRGSCMLWRRGAGTQGIRNQAYAWASARGCTDPRVYVHVRDRQDWVVVSVPAGTDLPGFACSAVAESR